MMPGTMYPVNTIGRPGIFMSHMCVNVTLLPSGKLIVIGLFVVRRFLTGVPFMMNIEVAPVMAIACIGAIVIAFAHSNFLYFVLQWDVIIVASLSSCGANAASWQIHLNWVGYNEDVGQKLFHLISIFTAPHRQADG